MSALFTHLMWEEKIGQEEEEMKEARVRRAARKNETRNVSIWERKDEEDEAKAQGDTVKRDHE